MNAAEEPEGARFELVDRGDGRTRVELSGTLDSASAGALWRELASRLLRAGVRALEVDASGVVRCDLSGAALLRRLQDGRLDTRLPAANLVGLSEERTRLLASLPPEETAEALVERRARSREVTTGGPGELRGTIEFVGAATEAFLEALLDARRFRLREVLALVESAGVDALPIVAVISFLIGLVIAFEAAPPLAAFGAQLYVANLVGITMIRELGPVMTAILLAGRSGSAFAAELGTMKVNEELSALTTMGLDPVRFLVLQRVLAGCLLAPFLTAYAMLLGVGGGVVVMLGLGFPFATVFAQLKSSVGMSDVLMGTAKSVVFGGLVSAVGCLRGLETGLGPASVGASATRAVVAGILLVVVTDALFAVLGYLLGI